MAEYMSERVRSHPLYPQLLAAPKGAERARISRQITEDVGCSLWAVANARRYDGTRSRGRPRRWVQIRVEALHELAGAILDRSGDQPEVSAAEARLIRAARAVVQQAYTALYEWKNEA